ncbi:MAG TPA: ABC transporter [Lachnospiraceae bacterium]|uniref:metal ABC transporter ATP-binding protein n=1 Tax=Anaerosporobacter sp. TaxID=1872529 RepID=UPI000EB8D372|nr:metal ABC transporter ATP-binding protein [Anaerosporobacter sp.]HAB62236.1 ABC transporter [Lachnospiraceae bacterium]
MSIVTCKDISIEYDGKVAVDQVSFTIEQGDYLCIVGENGSGKSTLVKALMGLLKLKSGEIEINKELTLGRIGYLPQQADSQKDFPASVYEIVLSGCIKSKGLRPFYNVKEKQRVKDNLERLNMYDLRHKSYRELSGGQQQRVLLARALCATDSLLVLDEPVTGLDPVVTAELYDIIEELNRRDHVTIIMVSHDVRMATKGANKILQMGRKVLFFGKTKEYINTSYAKALLGGGH